MGTGIRALQRGAVDDCQGDRDPKAEAAGTPISAANLFSRNIWLTYVRQDASPWVQAGIVTGTLMAWANAFASSVYTVSLGPLQSSAYAGLIALAVNILVLLVAQPVCQALHLPAGTDETVSDDYEAEPEPARRREPARAG